MQATSFWSQIILGVNPKEIHGFINCRQLFKMFTTENTPEKED
jgi:hypothetical protein